MRFLIGIVGVVVFGSVNPAMAEDTTNRPRCELTPEKCKPAARHGNMFRLPRPETPPKDIDDTLEALEDGDSNTHGQESMAEPRQR